jgi:hypothetical protein
MATIPDKVNTGALATIVAVGAISMVGISAALTAMVRSEVDQRADQVGAKSDLGPVRKLKGSQEAELNAPAARDPATGRAVVPIERAMDLVVEDLRQHPEHATAPPPPDAGKTNQAEGDAGAAADPAAGEAGATGEEAGSAPTEGTPAEGDPTGADPTGARPVEGQPGEGSQPETAPAPADPGAAPSKPETGNGKNKNKGARHAKAEPAAAPASPPVPPATP